MIVVLSVVGVLGAAGAAVAVNSELLATAVDRPIGHAAEVLAASPTTAPTASVTAAEPEASAGPDELLPTLSLPTDPTSTPTPTATPAPEDGADDGADDGSEGPDDHGDDDPPEADD